MPGTNNPKDPLYHLKELHKMKQEEIKNTRKNTVFVLSGIPTSTPRGKVFYNFALFSGGEHTSVGFWGRQSTVSSEEEERDT